MEYEKTYSHVDAGEHDDVIRWKHFSALLNAGNSPVPVNSPHKGQWRGALMFSFIYAWINDWVNNGEAGDLRRQRGHYDVVVMDHTITGQFLMTHFIFSTQHM